MLDVGLYVHVPFCLRKCGYCDFYSIEPAGRLTDDLVDALLAEMRAALSGGDAQVETIFVGGGTPTCLSPASLGRLLNGLREVVDRHRPIEFSVEANPATLSEAKAPALRDAGVTRISMGAQSFHLHELQVLDRLHLPQDVAASVDIVRRAGFEHLNLDLIFGIPGQTLATWRESLRRAVDLGPDHLSCYGLTYEPGTPLRQRLDLGEITRVDEDLEAEMYLAAMDDLERAGFGQYEISNFARPGGQCRHNIRYWRGRAGVGVGPGAASYLEGRRWRNVPDVEEYVRRIRSRASTVVDLEALSPLRRAGEAAMLGLRMTEGIIPGEFQERIGFDPLALFADAIARHSRSGLLEVSPDRIALTRQGRLLADAVMADFLSPGQGQDPMGRFSANSP
jgi:oxygen-independent coproporphyrinogen III oxidase